MDNFFTQKNDIFNKIRILSESTINRMAAGETIERPSSVVKELVENSIDAQANSINITIHQGGKNLIVIADNGIGIEKDNLELALERHATSKLNEENLSDIRFFGFRGEALPSIAAISKLKISSKAKNAEEAWSLEISGGEKQDLQICSLSQGTRIEIKNLFFSTPARLKFLKSDLLEQNYIIAVIKKIALAHPNIEFKLQNENKILLSTRSQQMLDLDENTRFKERISEILGKEFINNSIFLDDKAGDFALKACISLPNFNKSTNVEQFFFINNRPVKDKILSMSVKIAYQDFVAQNRYNMVAIFLQLPNDYVDVNAHPAKTEIRFKDNILIRNFVIGKLKDGIKSAGHKNADRSVQLRESFKIYGQTLPNFQRQNPPIINNFSEKSYDNFYKSRPEIQEIPVSQETQTSPEAEKFEEFFSNQPKISVKPVEESLNLYQEKTLEFIESHPLGDAKAQLHKNYIISQTQDSVIITDQHAAHERLVYEKLKFQYSQGKILRQRLLIPEIFELNENFDLLFEYNEEIEKLGFSIEKFADKHLILHEIPSILSQTNLRNFIEDLSFIIKENSAANFTFSIISKIFSSIACHNSVRSGRELNREEMNHLLREMEKTPHSGQCNHGRPTYIELNLGDIEKLFERS